MCILRKLFLDTGKAFAAERRPGAVTNHGWSLLWQNMNAFISKYRIQQIGNNHLILKDKNQQASCNLSSLHMCTLQKLELYF